MEAEGRFTRTISGMKGLLNEKNFEEFKHVGFCQAFTNDVERIFLLIKLPRTSGHCFRNGNI